MEGISPAVRGKRIGKYPGDGTQIERRGKRVVRFRGILFE
jgi:hypothetical protein